MEWNDAILVVLPIQFKCKIRVETDNMNLQFKWGRVLEIVTERKLEVGTSLKKSPPYFEKPVINQLQMVRAYFARMNLYKENKHCNAFTVSVNLK